MAGNASPYTKGDWVVHRYYGVGQIRDVEKKKLNGKEAKYYRVKSRNSTFWVPVEQSDSERVRPIASKYMMRKAIRALKQTAKTMSKDHNERRRRIKQVLSECSVVAGAELIRDLTARQARHGLNASETGSLEQLKDRLIREWAVCMEIKAEQAKEKFHEIIQQLILTQA